MRTKTYFSAMLGFRHFSSSEHTGYRFGFNGMEKDDEVAGNGNSYTTHYRQNDPRLGRWFSVDPKANLMPWQSPYTSMDNNPVAKTDPKGDCTNCLGALLGAAVDYGFQVAENVSRDGMSTEALYKNINVTSIVTSAGEGFITSGASVGKTLIVKTTAAIINNAVDVTTDENGKLSVNLSTDAVNVAKNTFIDMTVGETVGAFVPSKKIKSTLSKSGVNDGNVTKQIKKGLETLDIDVTRKGNQNVKKAAKLGVEATQIASEQTVSKGMNKVVDGQKDKVKQATNRE